MEATPSIPQSMRIHNASCTTDEAARASAPVCRRVAFCLLPTALCVRRPPLGMVGVRESAQEPPEGVRVEHVDAGDAVRAAGGVVGDADGADGLELLQELDEGIGLLP